MPLADVHGLFANPCVDEKRNIGQSGRQPVQPANCLVGLSEEYLQAVEADHRVGRKRLPLRPSPNSPNWNECPILRAAGWNFITEKSFLCLPPNTNTA